MMMNARVAGGNRRSQPKRGNYESQALLAQPDSGDVYNDGGNGNGVDRSSS